MDSASRIAVSPPPPPPPRAARMHVARAGRPRAHAPAPAWGRALARGPASALLGALAGLVAGAVVVVVAPVVGRTVVPAAASLASEDGDIGRTRRAAAASVSAVVVPAIDAGALPAPDSEAEQP